MLYRTARKQLRRGVSAVELALLLPFFAFLFVIAIDYARVFYFGMVVQNCARNGAYFASDYPNASYLYNDIYGYRNMDEAVTKDASNLSPTPTYTVTYCYTVDGVYGSTPLPSGYVCVTVSWQFRTITQFPGVPNTVNLSRSVVMKMAPAQPDFPAPRLPTIDPLPSI